MEEKDLKRLKKILLDRKAQIEKNILGVSKEMEELSGCELNDEADAASFSSDNAVENAIGTQQQEELIEINHALNNIKTSQYGICEMCEDDIGLKRLEVKAHARYCIDCREIIEKKSNN
ncbi:MAG: RNA polymerase-binding protein DksA [Campylobacterota bacterium]|nr:RNA polymerase-binding protein DksA [Campylobacterota bacterium]